MKNNKFNLIWFSFFYVEIRGEIEIAGEGANGTVTIDLLEDVAPLHAERIAQLAAEGAYDGVVFHRVIDGFMAQTGDVQFGKAGGNTSMAGRGGSALPDLPAEFSEVPYDRGIVGMARSQNPNSANSQFFICFDDAVATYPDAALATTGGDAQAYAAARAWRE